MANKILVMCSGLVGVVLIVVLLLQSADLPNRSGNGFLRRNINVESEPYAVKQFGERVTRISGIGDSYVYLSGRDPGWVIMTDLRFTNYDTLVFGVDLTEKLRDPNITIDSPNVYMYAKEISYMLKGRLDTFLIDTFRLNTDLITRICQISPNKVAIRGIDSSQTRQVFKVLDVKTGNVLHTNAVFQDQQFGGFEWDGKLQFDRLTNNLYYMPMFQNGLYCFDTALNLLYSKNTIDTVLHNTLSIGLVNEGGTTKVMSRKPREIVNVDFKVFNGLVYNLSGLRSDNETLKAFNQKVTFDVYDCLKGEYLGSFSLKEYKGKKVKDFGVNNNSMLLLFEGGDCALYDIETIIRKFRAS